MNAGPDHRIALNFDEEGGRFMFDEVFIEIQLPFEIIVGRRREPGTDGNEKQWTGFRGGEVRQVTLFNLHSGHAAASQVKAHKPMLQSVDMNSGHVSMIYCILLKCTLSRNFDCRR